MWIRASRQWPFLVCSAWKNSPQPRPQSRGSGGGWHPQLPHPQPRGGGGRGQGSGVIGAGRGMRPIGAFCQGFLSVDDGEKLSFPRDRSCLDHADSCVREPTQGDEATATGRSRGERERGNGENGAWAGEGGRAEEEDRRRRREREGTGALKSPCLLGITSSCGLVPGADGPLELPECHVPHISTCHPLDAQ